MTALTPYSTSPVNSMPFESTAITQDEVGLPSPLGLRAEWISAGRLRFMIKRTVDLAGALAGLIVLTPVMLLIALLIRLDSPGPVLFRQLRRGYRGRLFRVLKFRTMIVDAEQHLPALEESNESAGGVLFKLRSDPRVTPLGGFLRAIVSTNCPS